jgi:hypothetical protein
MEKFSHEIDPLTGVITQTGVVDDKLVIRKDADISPLIEATTALRNSDEYSRDGIKRGFFHVASIDPITQVELLKIGVDVYRSSAKELVAGLRRIHKDYLITTRKQV